MILGNYNQFDGDNTPFIIVIKLWEKLFKLN